MNPFLYLLTGLILGAGVVWVWQKIKIKKPAGDMRPVAREKSEAEAIGGGLAEFNQISQEKKKGKKDKIMVALQERGRITNDATQALLGVSDATATRYLDELEQEEKILQQGIGKGIFYTAK
ncbi:MAG: winged helix-turn-helix domain-containing protein [Candidatus Falkowbacteria bacterium]